MKAQPLGICFLPERCGLRDGGGGAYRRRDWPIPERVWPERDWLSWDPGLDPGLDPYMVLVEGFFPPGTFCVLLYVFFLPKPVGR